MKKIFIRGVIARAWRSYDNLAAAESFKKSARGKFAWYKPRTLVGYSDDESTDGSDWPWPARAHQYCLLHNEIDFYS
nr:hypothetical protein [uncultured bacterium]